MKKCVGESMLPISSNRNEGSLPVRVLVVDDSALMRRAISKAVESAEGFAVAGTANNGQDALEKIKLFKPDVITLDLEMPVMDGMTLLRQLKAEVASAPAVLVCSSLTSAGSHQALLALTLGAGDVIEKDPAVLSGSDQPGGLLAKLRALAGSRGKSFPVTAQSPRPRRDLAKLRASSFDAVVIGSSTGGPPVVEQLVTALPAQLAMPVLIAQHMPPLFTKSLAERLERLAKVPVHHGEHGMPVEKGRVYVASGGKHTRIVSGSGGRHVLEMNEKPIEAIYRPSVNELFASAAAVYRSRVLGIVLTGMGDDGMLGSRAIHASGGVVLTQEPDTCVVYGMPRSVDEAKLSDGSCSPMQLAELLSRLAGGEFARRSA